MKNLVNTHLRKIGTIEVTPLAFGCWRMVGQNSKSASSLLDAVLDQGINLIDTADVYGLDWGGSSWGESESLLGQVLHANKSLRNKIVLATKGGISLGIPYDSSSKYIQKACEDSLQRLQVEHIDLYQIHRPDIFTHPEEVASVLEKLVKEGKIGQVGVSNYTVAQTSALATYLNVPLCTIQPQMSIKCLQPLFDGTLDYAIEHKLTPLAWSPLAGGELISGKNLRPELLELLDKLAARESTTRAGIAIAFILTHPSAPIPILGTQSITNLKMCCGALTVQLARSDIYDLIEASTGENLP